MIQLKMETSYCLFKDVNLLKIADKLAIFFRSERYNY